MERYVTLPVQGLTDEYQILRNMRLNCLGSLFYFIRNALRRSRLTAGLHLPLCRSFERDHIKDVIEIPRDHFKSTCASEGLPMWRALPFTAQDEDDMARLGYSDTWLRWMRRVHDPKKRNMLASGNITNAAKLGKRIRNHFESNSIFRTLFPEILPTAACVWSNYSLEVSIPGDKPGHGEGTFDFVGVGSAVQSRHYNGLVVEDDLIGLKESESQALMDKAIDYHQLLLGIFEVEDPNHELDELVIGNRWGYTDLNSHIREHEPEFRIESHSALGGCCVNHPPGKPIFPEEFSEEKLLKRRQRLGSYKFSCFPAGTPVLMSNWTEKNIEDLNPGDEIVGYSTNGYMGLRKAEVVVVNKRRANVVKVTMKSGRVIYSTPDHKFLQGIHRERKLYDDIRNSKHIVSVYVPPKMPDYPDAQRDFDWLGGMFDGEGSAHNSPPSISQSWSKNPEVCTMISKTLSRLGISHHYRSDSETYHLVGGRSLRVNLLKHARMAKKQRFIDYIWSKPSRVGERENPTDSPVNFEDCGEQDVYNIQSSTGNYVAWGYAVKNCQFLNNPAAPEDAEFKASWLSYFNIKWPDPDNSRKSVLEFEAADGQVKEDLKVNRLRIGMVVDPNHSGNQGRGRCRHAIVVAGCDSDQNYYLLDTWAQAASFDTFYNKIFELAQKWHLTRIGVETVAAQRYVAHHIMHLCVSKAYALRIDELKGEVDLGDGEISRRKEFRIRNVIAPIAEQGRLFVQRRQIDFVTEYETFPRGRYVDQLDAFAYLPQLIRTPLDDTSHMEMLAANQTGLNLINQPYSYGYAKPGNA